MPASNDRRTLTIGTVAMVVFLLIGVGSAAVFARPSCRLVSPAFVALDTTNDGQSVLMDAALDAYVSDLAGSGSAVRVFDAPGADSLTVFGERLAAIGTETLLFDTANRLAAQITFRDGRVVGSGDVLYAVVLANPTSGQVDAVQPIDDKLNARTCVELALVSTPLAFLLDASDGEILFLRADEDGDDPFIEVRDPDVGRRLSVPVELAVGSAGRHGVRTSGVLTGDMIVFAQSALEAPDGTALWGIDRATGEVLFTVGHGTLRTHTGFSGDFSVDVRLHDDAVVVAVTQDTVTNDMFLGLEDGSLTTPITVSAKQALFVAYQPDAQKHPDVDVRDVRQMDGYDVLLVDAGRQTVVVFVDTPTQGVSR